MLLRELIGHHVMNDVEQQFALVHAMTTRNAVLIRRPLPGELINGSVAVSILRIVDPTTYGKLALAA